MRPACRTVSALTAAAACVVLFAAPAPAAGGRHFTVELTGAAEVPGPGDPDGSGTAEVTVDPALNEVCWSIDHMGIDEPTAAHIHVGEVDEAGGVVVPLDPHVPGCTTVEHDLALALVRDPSGYYVNVHTAAFPPGAIRGQLDPFLEAGTTSQREPTGAPLSPVDVRFGMHEHFDRIVVDLVGEGTPGWFVELTDDPRHQGSGEPVDVDGDAVIAVSVTGVQVPTEPGAHPYVGPDEIETSLAGIVEHVVVGSIFEGHQQLFIGLDSAQPYRVFLLEEPTRMVIDVRHPFATEVQWLLDQDIATGYADGEFHGEWPVSRQAMAAFVYRLVHDGADAPACTERPFPDVAVDNQFCGEIAWMEDEALSQGYEDGTYRPTTSVSRQAMAAFFSRLFTGEPEPSACAAAPFSDVHPAHPFCAEIAWMQDAGITGGYDDGTYRPAWPVTRQAMAAFMYRAVVEQALTPTV